MVAGSWGPLLMADTSPLATHLPCGPRTGTRSWTSPPRPLSASTTCSTTPSSSSVPPRAAQPSRPSGSGWPQPPAAAAGACTPRPRSCRNTAATSSRVLGERGEGAAGAAAFPACQHRPVLAAIIPLQGTGDSWYQEVKAVVQQQQARPIWTAEDQVRGAGPSSRQSPGKLCESPGCGFLVPRS